MFPPHLNYCNVVWSNTYLTHLTPLILIHKRIIRNIAKTDFLHHTEPLYKSLKILNIENIRKLNLALLMFKRTKLNEYEFPIIVPEHDYNTRHRDLLNIPPHRTTLLSNSFVVQSVRLWNKIPHNIKNSPSYDSFKKHVSKFLLR